MNIEDHLNFTEDKPAVLTVQKTKQVTLLAIGLLQDQILKKHKTAVPATLIVVKGSILFELGPNHIPLNTADVFQIPANELHQVMGTDSKNIFILLKENTIT
jgi:quercetin dioxygenase-like cupin family protein